jgi:hypothetical protein
MGEAKARRVTGGGPLPRKVSIPAYLPAAYAFSEAPPMENPTLSVADALRTTRELDSTYGALERRTGGLTWLIWGMAVAGIFMTYSYLGLQRTLGARVEWVLPFAWSPWVAMGYISTGLTWRSVALTAPRAASGSWKEALATGLLFVLFNGSALLLGPRLGLNFVEPALILLGLGDALAAVGILGFFSKQKSARLLWLVSGVALALVGIAGSLVWGADREAAYAGFAVLAPAAAAVAFFVNGIVLNLRN